MAVVSRQSGADFELAGAFLAAETRPQGNGGHGASGRRVPYAPPSPPGCVRRGCRGSLVMGFDLAPKGVVARERRMMALPNLDSMAGRHFTFRALCEVGETFEALRPDNSPKEPETYDAMRRLCRDLLDPLVDRFGPIQLTYGFAGPALLKHIRRRIDKKIDQHAGHEKNRLDRPICARGGLAVDLTVPGVDSKTVADWIVANTRTTGCTTTAPTDPST